ncbi:MAG: hypothetical protein EHM58_04530 [Ignavibacteriae bacterium]|nr:MAG: hypothetical protein EHM58_04530 [Ignavibacteriota bacterium]
MKSNISNIRGERIEQLSDYGTILKIVDDGAGSVAYGSGSLAFTLESNRVYEIRKIYFKISHFVNLLNYAFPKYEQFALNIKVTATLRDVNSNIIKILFNDLVACTSDGDYYFYALKEPFIFDTNNIDVRYLAFVIYDNTSVFVNLTGMAVPPVGLEEILIKGNGILEGISYIQTGDPINRDRKELVYTTPNIEL